MLGPGTHTSVKIAHNNACLLDLAGKLCILRKETITRMNHVHSVGNSNLDNLVNGKVCLHRSVLSPGANGIGLIRLWKCRSANYIELEDCICIVAKGMYFDDAC